MRIGLGLGLGASANAFSPKALASLQIWLRADLGFTPAQWSDQSGNGNHLVQETSSHQPSVRANINGKASIFFDPSTGGSEKYMNFSQFPGSLSDAHIFLVQKQTRAPTTSGKDGLWAIGSADAGSVVPWAGDGNIYDGAYTSARKSAGAPASAMNVANVYEVVSTSAEWTNKQNGTQIFTTATNAVLFADVTALLGASAGGMNFFDGDIAEFILCGQKLSSAQRTALIAYLNARYALGAT